MIRAFDRDDHSSEHPLVDIFVESLSAPEYPVGGNSRTLILSGRENIAELRIGFRVVCSENFGGPSCGDRIQSQSCSMFGGQECAGKGVCVNGVCECNSGFNGDSCQLNVDDCEGVNCSGQGSCLDGTNNYTCICDSGFSGQNCEVKLMQDICANVECSEGTHCEARTLDEQSPSAECVCNSNVNTCNNEPTTTPTDNPGRGNKINVGVVTNLYNPCSYNYSGASDSPHCWHWWRFTACECLHCSSAHNHLCCVEEESITAENW